MQSSSLRSGIYLFTTCRQSFSINASEALKQHGVRGFFSAKDVPGTNTWGPVVHDEEVLASKEVRYVKGHVMLNNGLPHCNECSPPQDSQHYSCFPKGQAIGLIVANTQAIAQEAARLVKIEYQELPYVLTIEEAIEQSSFFPVNRRIFRSDVDKAMKGANFVFEGEFSSIVMNHVTFSNAHNITRIYSN